MDQVLTNLIENAIRYTPSASPIEVSARTNGDKMLISVADRGPGIPLGDREHIEGQVSGLLAATRLAHSLAATSEQVIQQSVASSSPLRGSHIF